jgi:hypothetical protein
MTGRRFAGRVTYTVTAALLGAAVVTSCSSSRSRVTDEVTGTDVGGPVTSTSSSTSSPATPARGIDTPSHARADLQRLPVVARRPSVPGYQRSCGPGDACSFGPAWTDDQDAVDGHNGCRTRDDVLAAQLRDVVLRTGSRCVVVAGTLADPYTGTTITFSKSRAYLVPIDHVVPLALAWDLGAARWSQAQREAYANDPTLVLLAVDEHSNVYWSRDGFLSGFGSLRAICAGSIRRFAGYVSRPKFRVDWLLSRLLSANLGNHAGFTDSAHGLACTRGRRQPRARQRGRVTSWVGRRGHPAATGSSDRERRR